MSSVWGFHVASTQTKIEEIKYATWVVSRFTYLQIKTASETNNSASSSPTKTLSSTIYPKLNHLNVWLLYLQYALIDRRQKTSSAVGAQLSSDVNPLTWNTVFTCFHSLHWVCARKDKSSFGGICISGNRWAWSFLMADCGSILGKFKLLFGFLPNFTK